MERAAGLETCTKIYILFTAVQPSVIKNSQNLAILTLQFDEVTMKTIYISKTKLYNDVNATHAVIGRCP